MKLIPPSRRESIIGLPVRARDVDAQRLFDVMEPRTQQYIEVHLFRHPDSPQTLMLGLQIFPGHSYVGVSLPLDTAEGIIENVRVELARLGIER